MGNVTSVARTSGFWVRNLDAFLQPLKEFVVGESESEIRCSYSDYRKRSGKALIDMSSDDFSEIAWRKDGGKEFLDLYRHIQQHLMPGENCTVHLVCYEHAGDMSIEKVVVTEHAIDRTTILE